jgi:hypothetical protein
MRTEMWRVVDGHGGVREVPVRVKGAQMLVGAGPGPRAWAATVSPRLAVANLAVSMGWPVREILAPGELSAEERVAAERARCAAVCREVSAQRWAVGLAEAAATECAEAIERGAVER